MELRPPREFIDPAVGIGGVALLEQVAPPSDTVLDAPPPAIVIGGGPAGLRTAQELARRQIPVVLFNAERWRPYNRVKLTPFLAGEVQIGRVYQADTFPAGAPVTQYNGQTIVSIDREAKTVENQFGRRWRYSKLVLALGSHAYVPPIPGRELSGVFRFRGFDDVEQLVARAMRSRRTVVIGGGLLGLEAARGMALRKVDTVILEHEAHLMARQLDHDGGLLLAAEIQRLGLTIRTGCAVKSIDGQTRVTGITVSNGDQIACDTVIICTGIRSNIELARDADIAVSRGITVDNVLRTTDPDIYAVGECAEHDGHVYGLVAPGLEQAAVAAAHINGESANYRGSVPTTKLKVVGVDVFSMGDVEQLEQRTDLRTIAWSDVTTGCYRRLIVRRMRLVGALGVGAWPEVNRIQQAVRDGALVLPWTSWRFTRTGQLYRNAKAQPVAAWPAAATVCNCTGITRGQLGGAMAGGAATIETLMRETGASTVCGSCRPLLQELLGGNASYSPVFGARTIVLSSILAGLAALLAIFPPAWPFSSSVEAGIGLDRLWLDGTVKHVTGFTLLGLSALVAFLSVRKRVRQRWLGDYRFWRIVHTTFGAAALAVLFLHTGFNLGSNLNQWLMLTFLAVAAVGSVTGVVTAREHVTLAAGKTSRRKALTWLHIIAFWPMPVLLTLHVVTVYAY
jgi:NADPH-dependent 2,4-dienoyl-CoA reductase/sulfur reductase-like enzyme/bacterioferritin-associated ferredoxin